MPDPSVPSPPPARKVPGAKSGGLKTITGTAVLYVATVGFVPSLMYQLLASEHNWGEFWRVAAGPTGTMLAAAGAVMAASFTVLNGERSRNLERESGERDRRLAAERDLRARFTTAAAQLGDTRLNIRQAGAYAMAAIADDWLALTADEPVGAREAQTCIDVLCVTLRSSTDLADTGEPADQALRTVIMHIFTLHLREQNQSVPSWRHMRFDLTGARLHDVNLSHCHFDGSLILTEARFSGWNVSFTGSHFSHTTFDRAQFEARSSADFTHTVWNTTAVFEYTLFTGSVDFTGAHFNDGANYQNASIGAPGLGHGEVSFQNAKFVGLTDFTWMDTYSTLTFYEANFHGPAKFVRLNAAKDGHPASVSFARATFHGPADFETCHIGGLANFSKATFLGTDTAPTSLDETFFDSDESVKFHDAEFTMCEFVEARFERQTSFYGAKLFYDAPFRAAIFTAPVRFEKVTFSNGATFHQVQFHSGAIFYRAVFGTGTVDFTNPAVWTDVRVDWDGSSPYLTSDPKQPPNVLPKDWPPQAVRPRLAQP